MNQLEKIAILSKLHDARMCGIHGEAEKIIQELEEAIVKI